MAITKSTHAQFSNQFSYGKLFKYLIIARITGIRILLKMWVSILRKSPKCDTSTWGNWELVVWGYPLLVLGLA